MAFRPGRAEALPESALLVATVGRPHGLKGELRLFPTSEDPKRLEGLTRLWISPPRGEEGPTLAFGVEGLRLHGRAALVTVGGLEQREDVAAFVGWRVHALPEELPPWGEDEFAMSLVLGSALFDREERVGEVVGVVEISGRDYFEVGRDGRRVLVPAVKDWLIEHDLEGGRIVMSLPEGLVAVQLENEEGGER